MLCLKGRVRQIGLLKHSGSWTRLIAINLVVASATSGTLGACSSGSDSPVSDLLGADGEIAAEFEQFYNGKSLDGEFQSKFKALIDRAPMDAIDKVSDVIEIKGQQLTGFKAKTKILSSVPNFGTIGGKKLNIREYFQNKGVLTERLNAKDLGVGFNMLRLIGSAPANHDAIMKAVSKFSADQALKGASSLVVLDALIKRHGAPNGLTLQSADSAKLGLMANPGAIIAGKAAEAASEIANSVVTSAMNLASKENANCGSLNKVTDSSSDKYNEWQRCIGFGPQEPFVCDADNENAIAPGGDSSRKPATMCSGMGFKWSCECFTINAGKPNEVKNCKWKPSYAPPAPTVIANSCKSGTTNVVKP